MALNRAVIGIAGGSGSGKTSYANALQKSFNEEEPGSCIILSVDSYYKDQTKKFPRIEDRANIDFDHPDALDWERCARDLKELIDGKTIEAPIYNFKTHAREEKTKTIQPAKIIIIEGILVLHAVELKELLNIKVYIHASMETLKTRRIERDIKERGRIKEQAEEQYAKTVAPNHEKYVKPSADKDKNTIIIDNEANRDLETNPLDIETVKAKIKEKIEEEHAKHPSLNPLKKSGKRLSITMFSNKPAYPLDEENVPALHTAISAKQ